MAASSDRHGKRSTALRLGVAVVVAIAMAAGCKASWTPITLAPTAALQWPFAPAAARVTYAHALTGLARDTSAGTVLQSVVYGSSRKEGAFVLPVAVATGADGRIAVADTGCACVHFYEPATATYHRLNGSDRERLVSPVGVAFDDTGRLWVSDSSGALFAFDAAGKPRFVLRKAGGEPLRRPTGLAWSTARGLLYVVDTLSHTVHVLDADGESKLAFGGRGSAAGQLNYPTHIAVALRGDVYVTDTMNFRIAIFDADGHSTGSFGHHGDGSGDLAMPKGIAVDTAGVVYVVDAMFDNVQLFDRQGQFLLTVGARGAGFGEFWLPSGVFLDATGNFHVCDTYNRRIQVFRVGPSAAGATG
jgi:DNA-binding beta-propeller fold protein YncE